MLTPDELKTTTLGPASFASPINLATQTGQGKASFTPDLARIALNIEREDADTHDTPWFEKAGPRARLYFDPSRVRAAVVTCGGLCPGLNNVIRSLVLELHYRYRVPEIFGYRFGFEGLSPNGSPPMPLTPTEVRLIHKHGGSMLGLSRGMQDPVAMVDTLVRDSIDVLFAIGGDGTLRGAHAIALETQRRALPIAVVGVPKTIDNDVAWIDKTFGFDTAVELARVAVDSAHTEALSARNGVGIVKLMGRDAGFIAASATLSSGDVNFCLVPEVPFELEGPHGLYAAIERRLRRRGHALIVVAEGCASRIATQDAARDASGNVRYASGALDIGPWLRDGIAAHTRAVGLQATVKYIDPSYLIRSVPANAGDAMFCDALGRNAAHAAMAGRSDIAIGRWHGVFTHVPLRLTVGGLRRIDPEGSLWRSVIETTGQTSLCAISP